MARPARCYAVRRRRVKPAGLHACPHPPPLHGTPRGHPPPGTRPWARRAGKGVSRRCVPLLDRAWRPTRVPARDLPRGSEGGELGELGKLSNGHQCDDLDSAERLRGAFSASLALTSQPATTPRTEGTRLFPFRGGEGNRKVEDEGLSQPLLDSGSNGLPARTAARGWIE
jgi:hypothetical protein